MCLIISKTINGTVNWAAADRAAKINRDGYGVAYVSTKGNLVFKKSMKWDVVKHRAQLLEKSNKPFVLHQRFATNGAVSIANTHPFRLDNHHGMLMAHNGIIDSLHVPQGKSDTGVLAKHIDDVFPQGFISDEKSLNCLEDLLGGYSKLAFMDKLSQIHIVNEHLGEWDNGCWYSVIGTVSRVTKANAYNPKSWNTHTARGTISDTAELVEDEFGSYSPDEWLDNYRSRRASKLNS